MPKKKHHWNPEAETGDGTAPEVHANEGAGVPRDPPDPIDHDFREVDEGQQGNVSEVDEPAPSIREFLGEERDAALAAARRYLANLPHLRTIRDDREIIDKLAEHLHEALTLLPARWHLEHAEADRKTAEAKQPPLPTE